MSPSTETITIGPSTIDLPRFFLDDDESEDTILSVRALAKTREVAQKMLRSLTDPSKKMTTDDVIGVSLSTLQDLYTEMSQIVIVKHGSCDGACQRFLNDFRGVTRPVDPCLLRALYSRGTHVPLPARVADFNDNIAYRMTEQRGLAGAFGAITDDTQQLILDFEDMLREATGTTIDLDYQGSFLRTESITMPQPAHVDFAWNYLQSESASDVRLGFFPLSHEGMFLQVWPSTSSKTDPVPGKVIFIPYGTVLLVPCHCIHGGGFRSYGGQGNLRFHLYVGRNLPEHQTNTYTQPHDRSRELSEKYTDASILQEGTVLRQALFE